MRIISFFGHKGGAGKTTLAGMAAVAALEGGRRVAVLDLAGGRALSRFAARRREADLPTPLIVTLEGGFDPAAANSRQSSQAVGDAIWRARRAGAECLVVDTDTSRGSLWLNAAVVLASDVVITPVLDSPLDIEALLPAGGGHGLASFIEAAAGHRKGQRLRWLVARNRAAHLPTRLAERTFQALRREARANGFEVVEGLRERVAYREMFEHGATPIDPPRDNRRLAMSVLSARSETRRLMAEVGALRP